MHMWWGGGGGRLRTYHEPSLGGPGTSTIAAGASLTHSAGAVSVEMATEEGRVGVTDVANSSHTLHTTLQGLI